MMFRFSAAVPLVIQERNKAGLICPVYLILVVIHND